eukprot:TRINITY_DN10199_c0_g1_i2.p1 TRINITY_DN10199_c0_g1~~TRINITY_DN10199_c0_g1_i2.p1  ORF type:complete len:171 (-),score=39.57 TRINITY_DN10199_c0_g1_i2:261-773(-)
MANTFTIFNIGGPGWFHDVFEVQIVVDTDLSFQDPSDRFIVPASAHHPDKPTPIVDCTTAIHGNIIVKAPPGHKVYYEGVSLKLTEYCATLSPAATTELASHEHRVIGPGTVEGSVYIPFSLDARAAAGAAARERERQGARVMRERSSGGAAAAYAHICVCALGVSSSSE